VIPWLRAWQRLGCGSIGLGLALGWPALLKGVELHVRPAAGAMVVDGKLDEAAWASSEITETFRGELQPDGSVAPASGVTRVRALWTAERLYLAFECEGAPGPATLRERDAFLHTEEVVEVFLDFRGDGVEIVELQVSPAGVETDLYHVWPSPPTYPATRIDPEQRRGRRSDRAWNLAGLTSAVALTSGVNGTGWTAELSLPVAGLALKPQPETILAAGRVMRANFIHYRYPPAAGGQPALRQTSWVPVLRGQPHSSPMAMGTLRCLPAVEPTGWPEAWRAGSRLLVNDAHRAFAGAKEATRESRFGEAVALLNVQPRTTANVEHAGQLLGALAQEKADDDFGIMAEYYRGRIAEVHRSPVDRPAALAIYESLMRTHPGHLFAQMAAVKACVLRLYVVENSLPMAVRWERAEAQRSFFTWPEAQRDYHLVMADSLSRFGGPLERELEHALAAERAGHMDRITRANNALRVAEISRKLGRKDRAIEYYRKFLQEYSREVRVHLVRQRLSELEATP
jgi:hypothetical protein